MLGMPAVRYGGVGGAIAEFVSWSINVSQI